MFVFYLDFYFMKVKLAENSNINSIMEVIECAKQIMIDNGNTTQWINGYPSEDVILKDIVNQHGFVITNNDEIVGYFCFIQGNDPEVTYQVIEGGNWLNNRPYGVIHRLASNGKIKGVADACFDYCFSKIDNIKVDTHENNIPMQNYFKKIGFEYCGIIYVGDGSPRRAFQKEK